jgi:hypothetical protein
MLAADVGGETQVYRCTTPDGKIEFRQDACSAAADGQEVTIENRQTGWDPAKLETEQGWKDLTTPKPKPRERKVDKQDSAAKARQKEKCWEKRQHIEDIDWRLKRGYKPSTGNRLRHKRRLYEDYISQFCK